MIQEKQPSMIPLRYREILPSYWYENEAAIYHFEAAKTALDTEEQQTDEWSKQFLLPSATYGLDIWEWIYFGGAPGHGNELWLVGWNRQERLLFFDGRADFDGSYFFSGSKKKSTPVFETPSDTEKTFEERRAAIRRKNLARARFTMATLQAVGSQAGDLLKVTEHFDTKMIRFHFAGNRLVDVRRLKSDFERIRPVHVNGCIVALSERARYEALIQHDVKMKIRMKAFYPQNAAYFNGRFLFDGRLTFSKQFIAHRVRIIVKTQNSITEEENELENVIMTKKAREKIAKAYAGEGTVSPITQIGWGNGGHNPSTRAPVAPNDEWAQVPGEFLRKTLDDKSFPISTTLRMNAALLEAEGNGQEVSVCGLYDADGDLVAIKTFTPKKKDGDTEIEVQWDEEF
ncbi:hypothetical protein [Aneurinibacillus thermoaerophilus]|uniref:hypothetical protein n=1 Tax=Aneurinibacillus thermoaerophilus TaxID=143495 RepID=UPI002E1E0033|nr:hypothetical protein [Aneurinibacillus thermoaerophilus]